MSNTIRDEATLKSYFAGGKMPNSSNYSDLITTTLHGLPPVSYPSAPLLTVDASLQKEVIVYITDNIEVQAPSNPTDGCVIKWRFTATNGDFSVTWPTDTFRIPSSSTMAIQNTVSNGTSSIFVTEYMSYNNKWLIESYIWGY